jgi:hypothetical protein
MTFPDPTDRWVTTQLTDRVDPLRHEQSLGPDPCCSSSSITPSMPPTDDDDIVVRVVKSVIVVVLVGRSSG